MDGSNFEIRRANEDEMEQFREVGAYVFAENREPDKSDPPAPLRPEWTLAAFHGDRIVATSGGYPFKMRFNGKAIGADGVTAVGTYPGYRRRGLVRQMISGLMHDAHEGERPISILWASMGAIYQRFGYGLATTAVAYDIRREYVEFQYGEPARGYTRLMDKTAAREHCEGVYRAFTRDRTVALHRVPVMWDLLFRRSAEANVYVAVHFDADDRADAYCVYRTQWQKNDAPGPGQHLFVSDFAWRDMNGYRGIWAYLASHDLVERIKWNGVPEDDPAPGMLLEPRMLGRRTSDGIWLRVNDVDKALEGRGYDVPGEVTLRVREDDICPWNVGAYRVATSGETTEVERLTGASDVDLEVTLNGLASLVCGHASASFLHRIGRIEARRAERLPMLDAFFATRHRPSCSDGF